VAQDTSTSIRNLVIYSVFVRNHTPEGTFRAVIPDLPRIHALGTDVVWLMPIHPIGEKNRKGTLGSPYANRDYRTVNPEYGTMDDFRVLVDAIHAEGMKCMVDVVYNHTSPDSVLFEEHPEFFFRKPDGQPGNHVGDWSDVIDLDYNVSALWDYQIETLCQWARIVDGFRCDVASFVPVEFWKRARAEVAQVHPDCLWLAETVHRSFGAACRAAGMTCARDSEAFEAFDMEYEYDVQEAFERYLKGEIPLSCYLDLLDFQENLYPQNYDKLRFLENHDVPRIASHVKSESDLRNHTAMLYFKKGTTLIYAGQEAACSHLPSLFDRDTISWDTGTDLSNLMRRMAQIKHDVLDADDAFFVSADDENDIAVLRREHNGRRKVGVFSLKSRSVEVEVPLPDDTYENLIDGSTVAVQDGRLACAGKPIVVATDVERTWGV
jgi:glycosidase